MQALGAPGKTEKALITLKVTENRSCVFRIHAIPGDYHVFSCFTMHTNILQVFSASN